MLERALTDSERLSGDTVFQLWDTYGFPVEMTQEIASEQGKSVDMEGFATEMEAQRERARSGSQFDGDQARVRIYENLGVGQTGFIGYESISGHSVIVGIISGSQSVGSASEGQEVEIIMQETPFYPEGGGQVGDGGDIVGTQGQIEVSDTKEAIPDVIVHYGTVKEGFISVGDSVTSYVDPIRRQDTARNHTATHMLHAALRQVLGPHVRQAGSLVTSDRLRFDFSHVQAVTEEEMWRVQSLVNEKIRQNATIVRSENTYTAAVEQGALAFFGDKYGDKVRLVEIANGGRFSFEVCGGTHVDRTGEVGTVYVLGESSIGAGMRRIEAVSGRAAERLVWERFNRENRLAETLQTTPSEMGEKISSLQDQLESASDQLENLQKELSMKSAESLLDDVIEVDGVKVLSVQASATTAELLRSVGDWLRDKVGSGVIVAGAVINENPMLVAMVTKDLVKRGINASNIVSEIAKVIGGGGGGRPESAQAGGRYPDKLAEALSLVPNIVSKSLKES
tara:strand:+ start:77 stop:1606 length:1530 start_codon:yes stop_codon:yes gene_type:complete